MSQKLTVQRLQSLPWAYGQVGGPFLTQTLLFGADGSIQGYDHPNERRWHCPSSKDLGVWMV
ncbi:hypothetical protein, partial [Acidomonas methanolica]|uniref:hypothetical protein n=1 Tax=Acidomonas methanolica TaxID=437 RepID=UPI0019553114